MTRPPDRVEITTWTAVEGPVGCLNCSHEHWGWKTSANTLLAPQWHLCGRPDCDCHTLRTR